MTHTPHQLAEDFPDQIDRMRELRQTDNHFATLFNDYHSLNRAVHRAETDVEPTSDDHLAEMRRQRMVLKDRIYGYLST